MTPWPYSEALDLVLSRCSPLPAEWAGLGGVLGRVLAEDVRALRDDPVAAKSSMDGFALRAVETGNAAETNPVEFQFGDVLAAGQVTETVVLDRQAVRIMTGALVPEGADAVVKQEDTRPLDQTRFQVFAPLQPGENVIPAGAHLRAGQLLLNAGEVVSPQGVGILAGQGMTRTRVRRSPRVALLALGDELIEPGQELDPGMIYVSNIYGLEAECQEAGMKARRLGIARDDPALIERMIRPCLIDKDADPHPLGCEVILTLGGSHQGDYDFAEEVIRRLGLTLHFQRTRINMGGSTLFASGGGSLFFGLPGTPGASWLAFQVLVRPALMRLSGRRALRRLMVRANLAEPVEVSPSRTHFIPALLNLDGSERPTVTALTREMNLSLPPSLLANGLIHWPEGVRRLDRSDSVQVECLHPSP